MVHLAQTDEVARRFAQNHPNQQGIHISTVKIHRNRVESNDFEIFTETERSIGITSNRMQLSSGRGNYLSNYVQVGDITVWRYRSGHKIHHEYAFPSDLVELSIAYYPKSLIWCGMEVSGSSAAVHQGARVYECVTPPGGSVYGFVFPRSQALHWELFTSTQLARMAVPEKAVAVVANQLLERFLRRVDRLIDDQQTLSSPNEVLATHEMLVAGCQQILDRRFRNVVRPPAAPSTGVIKRAQELIAERLDDQLTASEIASELGVSRRGLELGFRRVLDTAPYQFVILQRLHKARQMLREDACTILEACFRSGFTNTGRFAKMYAGHFGELPSATLERHQVSS